MFRLFSTVARGGQGFVTFGRKIGGLPPQGVFHTFPYEENSPLVSVGYDLGNVLARVRGGETI